MPMSKGSLVSPLKAITFTSTVFSCLAMMATHSPRDVKEFGREDMAPGLLGDAVANCSSDIIRAHLAGPPMVAIVFADEFTWLPHLLAALRRPLEMPVLLLAFGKKARKTVTPADNALPSRNMSHVVFLPSTSVPFGHLFEQATKDPHWSPTAMHFVLASTADGKESHGKS